MELTYSQMGKEGEAGGRLPETGVQDAIPINW